MPENEDEKLNAILDEAMSLPEKERKEYLEDACRDAPELRARIENLIASSDTDIPEDFLQPSPLLSRWARIIYSKLLKLRSNEN